MCYHKIKGKIMKSLKKNTIVALLVAILLTVCFPAGILGIIFGATKHITALLIVGIVATVLGFYVMPIMWIKFGELKSLQGLLTSIENDNIYDVKTLSTQLSKTVEQTQNDINTLIQKRYLTGFLFVEKQHLEPNNNQKKSQGNKCPNCGSLMSKDADHCEYCGYKK